MKTTTLTTLAWIARGVQALVCLVAGSYATAAMVMDDDDDGGDCDD